MRGCEMRSPSELNECNNVQLCKLLRLDLLALQA